MITALDVTETRKYVSKMDPDPDNPTVFHLGFLDPALKAELDDESSSFKLSSTNPKDPADIKINYNKRQIMVIKFGLKNIENLLDPQTKKPVNFSCETIRYAGKMRDAVPDRLIAILPSELRTELAEAILSEVK
ncbi:MAG: hypothetical protein JW734_06540 [Candidatus Omnitrophica bacterium]|nr:hypothetical protein [Candidatus Omnitrophota bacterium]